MSGQASSPSQFAHLTEVYEAIRGGWCGERDDSGARLGLELLLRRGAKAWMQVAAEVPRAPALGSRVSATSGLPAARHTEVASLLLAMALSATRNEVST
jgi:hypothetical protein